MNTTAKPPLSCHLGFHRWGPFLVDMLYHDGSRSAVTVQHCDKCPMFRGMRHPQGDIEFSQWLRDLGLPF